MMPIRKSQAKWQYMWRHLVAKFLTHASGAIWWPNFSQCNWCPLVAEFPTNACGAACWVNLLAIRYLQLWSQSMGPLCLWQCLYKYSKIRIFWCKDAKLCQKLAASVQEISPKTESVQILVVRSSDSEDHKRLLLSSISFHTFLFLIQLPFY